MSPKATFDFIHRDGCQVRPKLVHGGTMKMVEPVIEKNDEHVLKEVFSLCLAQVVEFVQNAPHQAAILSDKRLPRLALSCRCTLNQILYLPLHSIRLHKRNPPEKKAHGKGGKGRAR